MLKFRAFGVPVAIEGWFWLSTVLLGGGISAHTPEQWQRVAVWVVVVFISVLLHELGHALVGRQFGASPFIRLHGFGGVTFLPGPHLTRRQNILVSGAGPAAGLILGLAVVGLDRVSTVPPLVSLAFADALYVNFFWTCVNLLPIQPLDGGQIMAQLLGPNRSRLGGWIGAGVATAACLWALSAGLVFLALMLAMLAYHNFRREPVAGGVVTP